MNITDLSKICDLYQATRQLRLDQEKVAAATKKDENSYKEAILEELKDTGVPTVGGTTHNFERVVKQEPQVDDWEELYAHIIEFNAFELLHKRLTATAVKERWDMDEKVPGVTAYPVESLSVTLHK